MNIAEKQNELVHEIKSWLNTPYHSSAKIKGIGVDCGQLLIAVYEKVGLLKQGECNPGYYSTEWHLHRSEEKYLKWVEKFCVKVNPPYQPGDIALFQFGRCISHGAMVIDYPLLIHAYIGYGVIESTINEALLCRRNGKSRLKGVYRWAEFSAGTRRISNMNA